MTHEDIEATKAPLMEHLIELRLRRLIKAVVAFGLGFCRVLFLRQVDLQRADLALCLGGGGRELRVHLYRAA